jgi:peroxiredoxin Q/BCP
VVILGASVDDPAANAKFAKKNSFPFPLLCDTSRALCLAYHAVENAEGRARRISYLIGADGKIEMAWPQVKPREHPQQVLDALGSLSGGPSI